jgi:hypothetical protein
MSLLDSDVGGKKAILDSDLKTPNFKSFQDIDKVGFKNKFGVGIFF